MDGQLGAKSSGGKFQELLCTVLALHFVASHGDYFWTAPPLLLVCHAIADASNDQLQAELLAQGLQTVHEAPTKLTGARTGRQDQRQ